jgi:ABC-type bacteriocin/lantibiotic exporter with double-glycine peptidase domain
MFAIIVLALICMVAGSSFLDSILDPHLHPTAFIVFWLVCGWLTLTALLMALFDVLLVRAQGRAARKAMKEEFLDKSDETLT